MPLLSLSAALLLCACGIGAQYPEFSAKQYRLEGRRTLLGEEVSGPAIYYRDGEYLRYEGVLENYGEATVIYDPARDAAYLIPATTRTRRLFAGRPQPRVAVVLSEGETPQPLEVAWEILGARGVQAIGRCRAAGERGTLWRPRDQVAPDVERMACITPDGIVLRLTENETTLFEATAVERGPQRRSLFTIPDTYRVSEDAEFARLEPGR